MSHFITVVLIPETVFGQEAIDAYLNSIMEPYSEELEVPEYPRDCYCIDSKARNEAMDQAVAEIGKTIDQYRTEFHETARKAMEELGYTTPRSELETDEQRRAFDKQWGKLTTDELWQAHIKDFIDLREKIHVAHPMYNKPNPECDECKGTGKYPSTYNPKSKWDWFVVGGRWNGWIKGTIKDDGDGGFNFGPEFHEVKENIVRVKDLLKRVIEFQDASEEEREAQKIMNPYPYAIVDRNGDWHQHGEMGWWGMSSNEMKPEDWQDEVRRVLADHQDCNALGIDCHI